MMYVVVGKLSICADLSIISPGDRFYIVPNNPDLDSLLVGWHDHLMNSLLPLVAGDQCQPISTESKAQSKAQLYLKVLPWKS